MNYPMLRKKTQDFGPNTPTKNYADSQKGFSFGTEFKDSTSIRTMVQPNIQPQTTGRPWGNQTQQPVSKHPKSPHLRTSSTNVAVNDQPYNKLAIDQTLHANLRSLKKSQVEPVSREEGKQVSDKEFHSKDRKPALKTVQNYQPFVSNFEQNSLSKEKKRTNNEARMRTPKIQKQVESGRFGFQFSFRSKKGYLPNVAKENQDICIVNANINSKPWEHFFAVCDGHGQHGHQISALIKTQLSSLIGAKPDFHEKPHQNIYKAFQNTFQAIIKQTQIDTHTSGSTIVSVYIHKNKLYCGNAGDSRAVLCSKEPRSENWLAKPLSNDHKPTHPQQAQRILRYNGRLQALKDQYGQPAGPLRVWLSNQQAPGLAMTRSMGDLLASQVGVTWQPEITEHTITPNDHMLIIASDGVWQFLSNEEVANLLAPYYQRRQIEEASKVLMQKATAAWHQNAQMIDDISFVIVFFEHA